MESACAGDVRRTQTTLAVVDGHGVARHALQKRVQVQARRIVGGQARRLILTRAGLPQVLVHLPQVRQLARQIGHLPLQALDVLPLALP
eukprot:scaffold128006_cov69-Phaeocystis_antarctica.AAC.2